MSISSIALKDGYIKWFQLDNGERVWASCGSAFVEETLSVESNYGGLLIEVSEVNPILCDHLQGTVTCYGDPNTTLLIPFNSTLGNRYQGYSLETVDIPARGIENKPTHYFYATRHKTLLRVIGMVYCDTAGVLGYVTYFHAFFTNWTEPANELTGFNTYQCGTPQNAPAGYVSGIFKPNHDQGYGQVIVTNELEEQS